MNFKVATLEAKRREVEALGQQQASEIKAAEADLNARAKAGPEYSKLD
jgi:hypothetical protein